MSTRLEGRLIIVLAGVIGLLTLAATINPLLASPKDPPSARVPSGPVAFADTPDNPTLTSVKQAVTTALAQSAAAVPRPQLAAPVAAPVAPPAATPAPAVTTPAPVVTTPPAPAPVSGTNYAATAFGACVRKAEEGGSYAWGPGNGGGAYQFLASTWYANGAAPGTFGVAGPAYQDQIFDNTVAADGDSPWRPYDGCAL